MNVDKQIAYWRDGAMEDLEAGGETIDNGHPRHGLFWVHLALEKMLKAHVVKATQQVPPKIHNLVRLAELSGVNLSEDQVAFLRRVNTYQLEGRYPESFTKAPVNEASTQEIVQGSKELLVWLTSEL